MGGWYGVDLDGTLAHYPAPRGQEIGVPIPKMLARVKKWLAEGKEVRIVTARVAYLYLPEATLDARRVACEERDKVRAWCQEHLGVELPVTAVKDFGMIELFDDRAVQVIVNTGERVDGCGE